MSRIEFTDKEARGVVTLLIIVLVLAGYRILYDYIDSREAHKLVETISEEDIVHEHEGELTEFDPNTASLAELRALGLSKSVAVSIIRYREYGKVYRIKEDLFTCYGVSDSVYYALEPYIVIADSLQPKRREYERTSWRDDSRDLSQPKRKLLPLSEFIVDTVGVKYLVAIGALSVRQAEVFVKWRDLSGIHNADELRNCYVVSDSIATLLEPYVIFSPREKRGKKEPKGLININRADSSELLSIYGIGEKSMRAIIEYREKLGGFYSMEQLSEIKMVSESNFEKIIQQILCDSCDISKIDVNFAPAKQMKGHPYITDKVLRRLLKVRELKGGWSTVEEMIEDNIFTEEEATRVRPYLLMKDFVPRRVTGDEFL